MWDTTRKEQGKEKAPKKKMCKKKRPESKCAEQKTKGRVRPET